MASLPSLERISALLARFSQQHIVVVGDMVADEYIYGLPVRISREAPVVVLEFVERRLVPGGATNVAINVRALGAEVSVVGVCGDDPGGRELTEALQAQGINTAGLLVDPDRPTSTKTRIVGGGTQVVHQQMVRVDRIDSRPLQGQVKARLLAAAQAALQGATGLILSDYEHGVIDPDLINLCLPAAAATSLITTVDAHGGLHRFKGVTLATPNQPEAEAALGRALLDAAALQQGGKELLERMDAQSLLITRGSLGLVALDRSGQFLEAPAYQPAEVRDATGAGDTVAAAATLALCAGASLAEAAHIGNVAAGIVVRRFGAATTKGQEILAAFHAQLQ